MSAETPAVREALPVYEIEAPEMVRVPLGYRQTEVGVIPEDWEIRPVGSMGEVVAGKALATGAPGLPRPYLRTKNVFDGRIDIGDVLFMPMTDLEFARYELRNGDVLLNEGQALELVGRCSIYRGEYTDPCAIQNQLIRFRARSGVLPMFAAHLFRYCQKFGMFAQIALQTTSVAHLGVSRFQRLTLAWPVLEAEQRAIADALSDVDALISALDKLIAKKRAVKTAAMQQLLTGEQRLPGFSGEWEARRLGDFAEINSGGTPSSNVPGYYDGRIPWVSISDMTKRGKYVVATDRNLTEEGLASSTARIFPRGTILYAMYASIGECSIASVDLCSSQAILGIRPTRSLNHNFLYFVLVSKKQAVQRMGQQGTQANLNAGIVKNFLVPVPPLEEQTAIATVLSDMDAEIEALEARREKTRQVKQGMMQELLTGRTRLV